MGDLKPSVLPDLKEALDLLPLKYHGHTLTAELLVVLGVGRIFPLLELFHFISVVKYSLGKREGGEAEA